MYSKDSARPTRSATEKPPRRGPSESDDSFNDSTAALPVQLSVENTPISDTSGISKLGDSSDLFDELEETYLTFDSPPTASLERVRNLTLRPSNSTKSKKIDGSPTRTQRLENQSLSSRATHDPSITRHKRDSASHRGKVNTRAYPRKPDSSPVFAPTLATTMVKEREPSAGQGNSGQGQVPASSEARLGFNAPNSFQNTQQAPKHTQGEQRPLPRPVVDLTSNSPEFGKTSPLRNPLSRANNGVFNVPRPGQARPEHHKPKTSTGPLSGAQPGFHPIAPRGVQPATDKRPLYPPPAATAAAKFRPPMLNSSPEVVEIPRPTNMPNFTTQAPPRPMFSGWSTVNSALASRQTIDLTGADHEDSINPDDAFKHDGFGAPDPYQYVDAAKANENIKALLEGAFEDEDEEKPRLRKLRKRTKPASTDTADSLVSKLKGLEVGENKNSENEPEEEEDEVDDGTVEGLKVKLLPHQVEGVAWMTDKEIGKKKTKGVFPKGGILADDMGLGKTIQSIALILTNSRPGPDEQPKDLKNRIPDSVSKCTLVVAPLALIKQWEGELKDRVEKSHALRVLIHHGPKRTVQSNELKKYDVVITTYQIIASEHNGSSERDDGPKVGCFGVHWYRIILDEAHTIKNRNAKSTKACYALRSHFRWCLTGTPMQNNLDELQSLIQFLRIKPYCDLGPWKAQITGPMKNGRGALAMRRLQYVLKAFMKRRTKDILKKDGALNPGGKPKEGQAQFKIVDRKVEVVSIEFNQAERQFYQRLHDRTEKRLQEMMSGEKTDYLGALTLLLRLRQACNHPDLVRGTSTKDKEALTAGASGAPSGMQTPTKAKALDKDVDDIADLFGGLSVAQKKCDICQKILHSGDAAHGAIRCNECEEDLNMQSAQKRQKGGKHIKDHAHKSKSSHKERGSPKAKARNRRVIIDSDDEDQEGEWVVPESERQVQDLGKAGGTDDEDAEGGGESINSEDSEESGDESHGDIKYPKLKPLNFATSEQDTTASSVLDDSDGSSSESETESDASLSAISDYDDNGDLWPSTKIKHLLKILHQESKTHKFIVFSQFTSMLDLVEPFLKKDRFQFARYDGSMRNDLREDSLNKLRNDPRCRILLCSLKCGSLGLNLTAASRVVILEPFWNPVRNHISTIIIILLTELVCGRASH